MLVRSGWRPYQDKATSHGLFASHTTVYHEESRLTPTIGNVDVEIVISQQQLDLGPVIARQCLVDITRAGPGSNGTANGAILEDRDNTMASAAEVNQ
jgi:hypothetical protein